MRTPDGMLLSILATVAGVGSPQYYFYDGTGNVVGIGTGAGIEGWYGYQPFGEDNGPTPTVSNPYRYASTYRDQEGPSKHQYYMMARYHDPAYGRFTQIASHWSKCTIATRESL